MAVRVRSFTAVYQARPTEVTEPCVRRVWELKVFVCLVLELSLIKWHSIIPEVFL